MAATSTIRPAAPGDQETLLALWRALLDEQADRETRFHAADDAEKRWRNDYAEWLRDETRRLFVAERSGRVQGFLSSQRWSPRPIYDVPPEVFIDELYVQPEARRQGLGRQLVEAAKSWADDIDAEHLRLSVLIANERARAFWRSVEAKPLSETLTIKLETGRDRADSNDENAIGF